MVCTTRLILRERSSLMSSASTMAEGNEKISVDNAMVTVLRNNLGRKGSLKKLMKCLNPTQRLPMMPLAAL